MNAYRRMRKGNKDKIEGVQQKREQRGERTVLLEAVYTCKQESGAIGEV